MTRLLFLIRSLERGGAERQLTELVKGFNKQRFAIVVATFYDGGALRPELEGIAGVRVLSLHKEGRWDLLPFLWRLWKTAKGANPAILHGYMGVSNELCLLIGRLMGAKVVWGLRASNLDLAYYSRVSRVVFRLGAWLSRFADLIIVNSEAGRTHYVNNGYSSRRMTVIHNGIDTEHFQPDKTAGQRVRDEWKITDEQCLIGHVGRLDPRKDHQNFLHAASLLSRERENVRFVCIGTGPERSFQRLRHLAERLGLTERLIWAGGRHDMCAVYNALDVLASSSCWGEGFPNVIGEAMACGVPCVVTDVGDSAHIVGDVGIVVPPKNPEALCIGWKEFLSLSKEDRGRTGRAARKRICDEFDLRLLVGRTETALRVLDG